MRGGRAALVVAAVYAHFLIFAQFCWVEMIRAAGVTATQEKAILGVMALAGVASGFWLSRRTPVSSHIRSGLLLTALSAVLAHWLPSWPGALLVSALTGAGLGLATVGLAALLPDWSGVMGVGIGTGLGYAACNVPAIFDAPPAVQAWYGVAFAIIGALALPGKGTAAPATGLPSNKSLSWIAVMVALTALVWMDSAAFFVIQHEQALKSGTWASSMLWRNAALHFTAALLAGWLLKRGYYRFTLLLAFSILALAALAVGADASRHLAGWFYPVAVSLYSTALVAWPGYFSGLRDPRARARQAAWIYAVAGWFGSANGIGMAQSLHQVPHAFVAIAAAVVFASLVILPGKKFSACLVLAAIIGISLLATPQPDRSRLSPIERGQQVYLSEGCIHCHSRYVRPNEADLEKWGPAQPLKQVLSGQPVLIGNRRQGPDLSQVGARRSDTWLRLHFLNPQDFSADSPMPSYRHLFADTRGNDLIAWLTQGRTDAAIERATMRENWKLPATTAPMGDGAQLFSQNCAVCHGGEAHGDGKLARELVRPPANLASGPYLWTPPGPDLKNRIARVIKFGIPGTDMPGHEVLRDGEVLQLTRYLLLIRGAHPEK
jgi:mono/diheme cytochrome c family protein